MTFVQAARTQAATLPATDPLRITLDYMLANAVGRANAKPTQDLINHLAGRGHSMSREDFQQTILKATREGSIFIGSSRHGLFLIETIDDARAARDFYQDRIRAEQAHLANLTALAGRSGWTL